MIKDVLVKKIEKYEDERGFLAELFRSDEFSGYVPSMVYLSVTKPGIIRGPHEHQYQSDCFAFIGPGDFMLYLWDRRESSETYGEKMEFSVGVSNPTAVVVPPGVVHGYKCISEVDALSLNFPDKLYRGIGKNEEVDEIRWEKDPNSPYKID